MDKQEAPPVFSLKLIKWLCREDLVEVLQGDLIEFHGRISQTHFKTLRYWFQVLNYLRPSTLKSFNTQKSGPMFVFNPLLAIRNLNRHRSTSLINVFGFTLGLVAAFFLFFYIQAELSVDDFNQDKEIIYRAVRTSDINGDPYVIGVTSGPYGPALENDFPETVTAMNRAYPQTALMAYEDRRFFEDQLLFADPNFFEFFDFPLLVGDPATVMSTANGVVLSKEMAEKYFGAEDPMGKTLKMDNEYSFIVSGIMDSQSVNSHLEFNMVFNIALFDRFEWFKNWWSNGLITYVKVQTPAEAEYLKGQFPDFIAKYFPEDTKVGRQPNLTLEPLEKVYFNHETRYDRVRHGNLNAIYILILVGVAILFIACFNYVNLAIAQSFIRAKEVGIRKVLGVHKGRLVLQFLGESIMILIVAVLLSIGLCELLNPLFNSFFQIELNLQWLNPSVLTFLILLLIFTLLTSGVYPALLLSSYKPVSILRGGKLAVGNKIGLRKGLVITQFSISIFLIVATLLISIQNNYLNSKELGFDREAVVLIDFNNQEIRRQKDVFKERLLVNSNIVSASSMSGEPGGFHDATVLQVKGTESDFRVRTAFADVDYLNTLGIELVSGRNFDGTRANLDSGAMMINESTLEALGMSADEVLNKDVSLPSFDLQGKVIGVVKDFHFTSLRDHIEPMVIVNGHWQRVMAVKVTGSSLSETLLFIDEVYSELIPDFPMTYEFLDASLERLYENEQKQARIFSAFSTISVFLACLGIFGLAAYSAQRRQKELGIRKVLGATAKQIIALISKEFVVLVLIGMLVAVPVIWIFIQSWLETYAYRIEILSYWYVFFAGGILSVIIALITVTFKTYRAAVSAPTESIRNE